MNETSTSGHDSPLFAHLHYTMQIEKTYWQTDIKIMLYGWQWQTWGKSTENVDQSLVVYMPHNDGTRAKHSKEGFSLTTQTSI